MTASGRVGESWPCGQSESEPPVVTEPTFEAGPNPANLIEGLRDFGYTLESALADIIDNSISAGASRIDILAEKGDTGHRIAVLDDGIGMSKNELREAMRLAGRNPLERRVGSDLGRFGLGLKTASFSQCRRLTVATRRSSRLHVAVWDLDYVAKTDRWLIIEPKVTAGLPWIDRIGDTGTLVIWENLDRLDEALASVEDEDARFNRRVVESISHLELVFHRFLVREGKVDSVEIRLNGQRLSPFDPFARAHPATVVGPIEDFRTADGVVRIQPFTLPHHSKASAQEWDRIGGSEGFIKNQGFYVYRARRLIVWGTWFGLARQSERTKLARVKIDLPNDMDDAWKINVLKAHAQPPAAVRERLKRLIDQLLATSRRVYAHKGQKTVSEAELPVWTRVQSKTGIFYQPDLQHPAVQSLMSELDAGQQNQLISVMNLLAKALPVDSLLLDMTDHPERVVHAVMGIEELSELVRSTVTQLRARGIEWARVARMLKSSPPFSDQWPDTEKLLHGMEAK